MVSVNAVGPTYDCAITNSADTTMGFFIKPGTYQRNLQTTLRAQVIAAVSQSLVDRDIQFWSRVNQSDWSEGAGQNLYDNTSMFRYSYLIDTHNVGQLGLIPQTVVISSASGSASRLPTGTGGVVAQNRYFMPWLAGLYIYGDPAASSITSASLTTPATGQIGDIVTNSNTVWFSFTNASGVWYTAASAPANLVQYCSGNNGPYKALAYDPLGKKLYGADSSNSTTAAVEVINSAAVPTNVFDFVVGRVDALEMHLGNLIIAWNDSPPGNLSGVIGSGLGSGYGNAKLYAYDGSSMDAYADMPNKCIVVALKSAFGLLFIVTNESDPLNPGSGQGYPVLYSVASGSLNKIGALRDTTSSGSVVTTADVTIGAIDSSGPYVWIGCQGETWMYDITTGGLSRQIGATETPTGTTRVIFNDAMNGLVASAGTQGGTVNTVVNDGADKVYLIRAAYPSSTGFVPQTGQSATVKLVSSRFDAGVPYINKFWYGFDCIFDDLASGESIAMDYSLDDGVTFTACSNSPYSTVGGDRVTFLVKQNAPTITYRVRPITTSTVGPKIHAISPRYTVLNAAARVWEFTVMAYDQIRGRNNDVENPGYGQDALDFLFAIGDGNAPVTFYEPNDQSRTAHTCWVVDVKQATVNTGGVYDPVQHHEGDVVVSLWEIVSS